MDKIRNEPCYWLTPFLTNKVDQAGTVILKYAYDPDNRLTNRWSVAKGNTKYAYDPVGNLTNIDYAVSTDVRLKYDSLNRLTNMVDAAGTTAYTYTSGNQLLTDDGPFGSDTLTNTYLNRLRTGLALQQASVTVAWTNKFVYDLAGRLTNVTSPAGVFGYTLGASGPASPLIKKLLLPNTSYITNNYGAVARLTGTTLKNSSHTTLSAATYGYNTGNQRTTFTNAAGAYYQFDYDRIGQLKVANSSSNPEDRGYSYDAAWNLNWRTNNGAASSFTVDSRNQLTADAAYTYVYDANGNLVAVQSGESTVREYTYDDENRLASATYSDPEQPTSSWWRTLFGYDGLGRLRQRDEATWLDGYGWYGGSITYYIYDGMRVIQERGASMVSYTRGTDLSGSLEGAGGIGGLLARSHGYSFGNWTTHNFYHADGNGNVVYLVNSSQTVAASYRYDPFGNTISKTGTLADANVYRFSSKEIHANSGLYYYGYRFYDPSLQRWLNRDPLVEWAGENVFSFCLNNPAQLFDPLGDRVPPAQPPVSRPPPRRMPRDPAPFPPGWGFPVGGVPPRSGPPVMTPTPDPKRPSKPSFCFSHQIPPPTHPPGDPPADAPAGGEPNCYLVSGNAPSEGQKCWSCNYLCTGGGMGSYPISRYQPGGCARGVGWVPGWPINDQEGCEKAASSPPNSKNKVPIIIFTLVNFA